MKRLLAAFLILIIPIAVWAVPRLPDFNSTVNGTTNNKFGFDADTDTTEESVWDSNDLGGPVRCPSDDTAFGLYISSDSDSDVGLELTVEGLDANWDQQTVVANLGADAGTGTVSELIGTFMRVNRAFNSSGTAYTGNIYMHIDSDGTGTDGIPDTPLTDIKAVVTAGEDQTLQACYTVPDGFEMWVNSFCFSNLGNVGAVTFRMRLTQEGGIPRNQENIIVGVNSSICNQYQAPQRYQARDLLEVTGEGSANNNATAGSFNFYLVVP
jgi:hypothetical protein